MRSRAHFRSHPLHPMLVHFPIAFLTGGFAADVAGLILGEPDLLLAAWYLLAAGIVGGVVAAVPGLVDYRFTVPPRSSAKRRATRHMILNISALLLFAAAWFIRGGPGVAPEPVLIVVEGLGAVLLGVGGWLGGILVHRNQVGIDHRYARAGKWTEETLSSRAGTLVVAREDELQVDQMKLLHVAGKRIVLARNGDGFVAFSDHCPHRGGSLAGGVMACGVVICPWHGSQFDVRTGTLRAGPAESGIDTFPVEVVAGSVHLTLLRGAEVDG